METMGHDSQSENVEPDEVILSDASPDNVVELEAWRIIEFDNPPLYNLLAQMAANIQEIVDWKRKVDSELEGFMSSLQNGTGMMGMVMRNLFKGGSD